MAEYQITNGVITAVIDSKGVELKSLKKVDTGEEIMWNADPKYWNRTSPLLFPFIGGLKNKEYHYQGKTYAMEKHGFVRDAEFQLLSRNSEEIWFFLKADERTIEMYPFDFLLEVGYCLEGRKIAVKWQVRNQEAKDMYFSIGGHPAFKCPRNPEEKQTDCFLKFNQKDSLTNTMIGSDGLTAKEQVLLPLVNGEMAITENLFEQDALIIEDYQLNEITFLDSNKEPYVKVCFDTPVVGIWSMADPKSPFICVEPWEGSCDATDFKGSLEERKWGNHLKSGEVFKKEYTIEI